MKRQISIINEPDWSKNMAATDQCIFAMGGAWLLFVVCRLSSNSRELEWARNLKLGPMIGNDVHQLLLKYEPSQPDGGAVTKA